MEFIPRSRLSPGDILEYGADLVILATGAHWVRDGLNSLTHEPVPVAESALDTVFTPEQIMLEGREPAGDSVLVVDAEGYYLGVSLSERFARMGKNVTLVTPFSDAAPFTFYTLEGPRIVKQLYDLNIRLLTQHFVREVRPGGVDVYNVYTPDAVLTEQADSVVFITQRRSNDSLYRELNDDQATDTRRDCGITAIYRIGDCVAPRLIADAIFDGHRLAREIDSEDPAKPLPFIRERRLLGDDEDRYDAVIDGARTGLVPRSSRLLV